MIRRISDELHISTDVLIKPTRTLGGRPARPESSIKLERTSAQEGALGAEGRVNSTLKFVRVEVTSVIRSKPMWVLAQLRLAGSRA